MLNLLKVLVRPVRALEQQRFKKLMQKHHYLGALPKISETLWYVATFGDQWVALLSFSAAALKCSARDRWIGWDFRHQYDRLKLVTNNSRFLILPDWHFPNLASRILSLCQKRLPADWQAVFRPSGCAARDLCGPATVCRNHLQSSQLDICGQHQRLSSHPQRLQHHGTVTKNGFCQTVKAQCASTVIPAYPQTRLPYRRSKNHAQCTTNAIVARLFYRNSRSAPCPRTTPSTLHGLSHCRRRYLVWDARLPGHLRLGQRPWTKGPTAFRLPIPKQTLHRTEPVDHP